MSQPSLETRRLLLRPFSLSDAPDVQHLAGSREIADTTLTIPHPYPDDAAEAWIRTHPISYSAGTGVVFAIVLRAQLQLCGAIGLAINPRDANAELGYWIGAQYWNQGYATEAARAVVDYGFASLGLHRIYARHFARNPASGRVMQHIGMQYEGRLREHVRKWAAFEDLCYYSILAREWRPHTD